MVVLMNCICYYGEGVIIVFALVMIGDGREFLPKPWKVGSDLFRADAGSACGSAGNVDIHAKREPTRPSAGIKDGHTQTWQLHLS